MEMLELRDLHKTFNPGTVNEKVALNGVSLTMEAGDFATIVGSNGAGKSTLFNAIPAQGYGPQHDHRGESGAGLPSRRDRPQRHLLPHLPQG